MRKTSKILITSIGYFPDSPSGGTRLAYDLAHGLAARGHVVTLLAQDAAGLGREREQDRNVTVLRYHVERRGPLEPTRASRHIRKIQEILRKYNESSVDIINGHDLLSYVAAVRFYNNRAVRHVYTAHSPAALEMNIVWGDAGTLGAVKRLLGVPLTKRYEYESLKVSNAITALSTFTYDCLEKLYGKEVLQDFAVIPGWVDTAMFVVNEDQERLREELGLPLDVPILLSLRRLAPRMGLDNLLEAIRLLQESGYTFQVIIGGQGPLQEKLEGMIQDTAIGDRVKMLGFVPEETLPKLYAASDATVIPTRALECFGIIALESLACGKTTLVTPVGALSEVMNQFEPGWIADNPEPAGIARLIMSYLDGELPEHNPQYLHNVVEERFSFEEALDRYEWLLAKEK